MLICLTKCKQISLTNPLPEDNPHMEENRGEPAIWILRLLRSFCPSHLYEEIEGDLIQSFERDLLHFGDKRAKRKLFWNALCFFRPSIILRNKISIELGQPAMFENYFKTTFRHVLKSKVNFTFKLGGLTLALFSILVIVIYVSYQLSFDRYHDDFENIFRVNSEWQENGTVSKYAIAPTGIGPALKDAFPEIKSYTRLRGSGRSLIKYEDKSFRFFGLVSSDSSIFDVLSFDFLAGDKHALDRPGSIVLTRSVAKQIFGDENPLNKVVSFPDRFNESFEVAAIIEDTPRNSHLHIDALLPFDALLDSAELAMDPWGISIDGSAGLYIKFRSNYDLEQFVSKVTPFLRKRMTKSADGRDKEYAISLQPIKGIFLAPGIYAEFCAKGNVTYVYVFVLLGIFLVVIASINYINLSIADFHKRNKEIGVRRMLGARKKQIGFQVLIEASLVCFLALILGLVGLCVLFPKILQLLDANLSLTMLADVGVMISIGCALGMLIILSTVYPAYKLATNKPFDDLKSGKGNNSNTGKILLLAQFAISIICISATFVVGQQIDFIQTRNPGYDRHNVIVVYPPDRYPPEKIPVIKEEFKKLTGVEAVSYATFRIAGGGYYRDWYKVEIAGEMKQMMLNEVFFDHDFFEATGIPLIAGRSFDPNNPTDSHSAFIVNETAVREFGWDDPIGKRINYGYGEQDGEKWEGTVIGVVKDFNIYSLHKKIEPLVMRLPWSEWPGQDIHIRINGPLDQTIASIKKKYEEILPGFILDYSIIEDIYDSQYQREDKAFTTLQFSTWIIVLISSIGIFSLSIYMSAGRMKEFGIRKVLGATARQITLLHVGHFFKVALLANVVALPLAYWLMKEWLKGFAYQMELGSTLFLIVACISFLLVIISAGYSAWKAGRMNPVDVIKKD